MKTQVAIVGGGPAGAASALYLARLGIKSVIIEREAFPRYHIGESMTGEAGGQLRGLGLEQQMMKAGHIVKHGVSVWGGNGRNQWFVPVMQRLDDGTLRDQVTWQVRRSEFDKMMLDEAMAAGATRIDGRAMQPIIGDDGAVRGATVLMRDGGRQEIHSEVLLDCSGQATWLANRGVTGPKHLGAYDKQIAIFSQVTGLERDPPGNAMRDKKPGNTLIFVKDKYHWAWAIPIDDQVTSVGVVAPSRYFLDKRESKRDYLARELKELNPALTARLPEVNFIEDVHAIPNYSFQVTKFAGPGYICIGDAHRFLDPIFSFGVYLTMREAELAAPVVRDYLNGKGRGDRNPFEDHMIRIERGADMIEDLIDAFWENPLAFAVFAHQRHREDIIDVLAGRVYDIEASTGVEACRELLMRTRVYDKGGPYSVPIGSRFQPERAQIWNAKSDAIPTTETWMRDN